MKIPGAGTREGRSQPGAMERKFFLTVLAAALLFTVVVAPAVSDTGALPTRGNGTPEVTAYFFYDHNCVECQKTLPFIRSYGERHPNVHIEYYDLSENRTYRQKFEDFKKSFETPYSGVPTIFIGDVEIEGGSNIEEYLEKVTTAIIENTTVPQILVTPVPTEKPVSINQTPEMNPYLFIAAALGEGANPCGLLVLALLLVSLMAVGSRRTVFLVGVAFIVSFFVVRLLSGFALFSLIQIPGISWGFSVVAGIIAIIAGIIQVKDGLAGRKGVLSIPESKKGLFAGYIAEASVSAGVILGALTGIYGMACTAGIYLAILGMLGNSVTEGTGFLYLAAYNLIVVVPLLAIVLLVFFGLPPEKVSGWREEQKGMLRMVVGIIMILLGVYLLATRFF